MSSKRVYVVVKDFNKIGSLITGFDFGDAQGIAFSIQCRSIAKPPIQVVNLGGPDVLNVYSEYKPYKFVSVDELLEACRTGIIDVEVDGSVDYTQIDFHE